MASSVESVHAISIVSLKVTSKKLVATNSDCDDNFSDCMSCFVRKGHR